MSWDARCNREEYRNLVPLVTSTDISGPDCSRCSSFEAFNSERARGTPYSHRFCMTRTNSASATFKLYNHFCTQPMVDCGGFQTPFPECRPQCTLVCNGDAELCTFSPLAPPPFPPPSLPPPLSPMHPPLVKALVPSSPLTPFLALQSTPEPMPEVQSLENARASIPLLLVVSTIVSSCACLTALVCTCFALLQGSHRVGRMMRRVVVRHLTRVLERLNAAEEAATLQHVVQDQDKTSLWHAEA